MLLLCPAVAAYCVAPNMDFWLEADEILEFLNMFSKAVSFLADASAKSAGAKFAAFLNSARRAIWLKT